eukprot:CFRG4987T1
MNVDMEPVRPGQVIVKTDAATSSTDILVLSGDMQSFGWDLPVPFTFRYDIAGIVVDVGEAATNLAIGDRVFCVNTGQNGHNI